MPVSSRQSPSDATAPTAIPKRNNVPVDPVRCYPNTVKSVSGWPAPALLSTPSIAAASKTINPTMTSIRASHLLVDL